jgi:hypothetical protein
MPSHYSTSVDWTEDKTPILTGCRTAAALAWLTFDVAGCTRCRLVGKLPIGHPSYGSEGGAGTPSPISGDTTKLQSFGGCVIGRLRNFCKSTILTPNVW